MNNAVITPEETRKARTSLYLSQSNISGAIGVHTPIDIDIGTATAGTPGNSWAVDLVSRNGFGSIAGQISIIDDRNTIAPQDDICDDGVNSGDTLSCFFAVPTNITWTATDTAGKSIDKTQLVAVPSRQRE